MILKQKLTLIQSNVKAFKTEMKGAIETKCVNEIGGNMLSQALASKSVSRNEIEEMKAITKQEKSEKGGSVQSSVNPETFFYSLKQLSETLGMNNQKFMDITPQQTMNGVVVRQKHEVGSRIIREIFEEDLNDIHQLNNAIKQIEFYQRQKQVTQMSLNDLEMQYEKLVFGNSELAKNDAG